MKPAKTLAFALPGAAAVAVWSGYRHAVREFQADRLPPPRLPGHVRSIPTYWGRLCYRMIEGSPRRAPLVLIHGWGRSADTAWWPLLEHTDRTVLAVDLPGHGRSTLEERFSFDLAAEAIDTAVADAGIRCPILVGHSMGGPIALIALRDGSARFGGLVAIATSAYWVSPHLQVIVAAAPYLLAPRSPIVTAAMRREARRAPDARAQVTRSYALRPSRRVLAEAAMELRRFDARVWEPFPRPPTLWLIAEDDGVIAPVDQIASAQHFQADLERLSSDHAVLMSDPRRVTEIIDVFAQRCEESGRPGQPGLIHSAAPRSVMTKARAGMEAGWPGSFPPRIGHRWLGAGSR